MARTGCSTRSRPGHNLHRRAGDAGPCHLPHPALDAARYHTQIAFARTYRLIQFDAAIATMAAAEAIKLPAL
jgi:hypothetical protein